MAAAETLPAINVSLETDPSYEARSKALEECFHVLDKDQSGYIDFGELRALASRMRGPKVNFEEAEKVMQMMDANGDQKISLQEYLDVMEMNTAGMDDAEFQDVVEHVLNGLGATIFAKEKSGDEYLHPKGATLYVKERVVPVMREALMALLKHVEGHHIELLVGHLWDNGFLPDDWQPASALRWISNYLRENNPYKEVPLPLGGLDVEELKARPWEQLNRRDKLTLAFIHLDRDQSGWLDAGELLAVAGKLGREEDVEAARKLLGNMDLDGNERVDLEEYIAALTTMTATFSDAEFDSSIRKVLSSWNLSFCNSREEKLRLVFTQLDTDRSGMLTLAELADLARRLEPDASDERILATLDYLDADHSSEITEDEFVVAMMKLTSRLKDDNTLDECILLMVQEPPESASGQELDVADGLLPPRFASFVRGLPTHKTALQISALQISEMAANPEAQLLIIDVRSAAERAVSCIPTSLHLEVLQTGPDSCTIVDPGQLDAVSAAITALCGLSAEEEDASFFEEEGTRGPTFLPMIVAYCSCGQKGGIVAQMLSGELGMAVHNLLGGAINWFNTGGMMLNPAGQPVRALHPGSIRMATFITHPNEFSITSLRNKPTSQAPDQAP